MYDPLYLQQGEHSFKVTKSVTMNIFRKKVELSYVFTINLFLQLQTAWKSELSYKTGVFLLFWIYLRPSNNSRQLIFNINAVVLALIIC